MLMGRPNNNFELGYENNTDDLLMTEFVPVGETVQDWSQMITIQSFIGYRPETLESFATRFTQLVINECSTSDQKIIWSDVQYGYDSLVLAITCQENLNTGLPEWMLVKAIQGDDVSLLIFTGPCLCLGNGGLLMANKRARPENIITKLRQARHHQDRLDLQIQLSSSHRDRLLWFRCFH